MKFTFISPLGWQAGKEKRKVVTAKVPQDSITHERYAYQ